MFFMFATTSTLFASTGSSETLSSSHTDSSTMTTQIPAADLVATWVYPNPNDQSAKYCMDKTGTSHPDLECNAQKAKPTQVANWLGGSSSCSCASMRRQCGRNYSDDDVAYCPGLGANVFCSEIIPACRARGM